MDEKQLSLPGPGFYSDQNKWNKRTYNLKFLNFQAHAFNNTVTAAGTTKASPPFTQNNFGSGAIQTTSAGGGDATTSPLNSGPANNSSQGQAAGQLGQFRAQSFD